MKKIIFLSLSIAILLSSCVKDPLAPVEFGISPPTAPNFSFVEANTDGKVETFDLYVTVSDSLGWTVIWASNNDNNNHNHIKLAFNGKTAGVYDNPDNLVWRWDNHHPNCPGCNSARPQHEGILSSFNVTTYSATEIKGTFSGSVSPLWGTGPAIPLSGSFNIIL